MPAPVLDVTGFARPATHPDPPSPSVCLSVCHGIAAGETLSLAGVSDLSQRPGRRTDPLLAADTTGAVLTQRRRVENRNREVVHQRAYSLEPEQSDIICPIVYRWLF